MCINCKLNIIYPPAEQHLGGKDSVQVNGNTVNECVSDLVRQYPAVKDLLFDTHGQIHSYFTFFINGEFYPPVELTHPVNDGDELTISVVMSGG